MHPLLMDAVVAARQAELRRAARDNGLRSPRWPSRSSVRTATTPVPCQATGGER